MENAVDAFKMAFAVILFTMSLSLAIFMFSEARETADIVLHSSDITEFMEYIELDEMDGTENRVVGLETIIPTLYKYYKENYTVIFLNTNGEPLKLYETQTNSNGWSIGYVNKYYSNDEDLKICSFDVDEETKRYEPWTGNSEKTKQMIDCFITGKDYKYTDSRGIHTVEFLKTATGKGLKQYSDRKFIENLGEYTYNAANAEREDGEEEDLNSGLVKNKKKRVIIYTLQ